jgi:hypothetical protein
MPRTWLNAQSTTFDNISASLVLTEEGEAVVRIINDRVGHSFPASRRTPCWCGSGSTTSRAS